MFSGQMPDITPGQIAALLTFIGSQAVAYGLIDASKEQTLISVGGIIIAAVWKIADALLRGKRAVANAATGPAAPIEPPLAPGVDGTEAPASAK